MRRLYNNVSFMCRDGSNDTKSYLDLIELVLGLTRCWSGVVLGHRRFCRFAITKEKPRPMRTYVIRRN